MRIRFFDRPGLWALCLSVLGMIGSCVCVVAETRSEIPRLLLDIGNVALREKSPTVLERRAALIDHKALKQVRTNGAKLKLNLFPETQFVAVVEQVLQRSDSSYTLTGYLEGERDSSFVAAVQDNAVAMNVRSKDGELLQVSYLQDGIHEVRKIDQSQFPPCATGPEHSVNAEPVEQDPPVESDTSSFIDVMVVYTEAARTAAGGESAIQSRIQLALAESNLAYELSQVGTRLRLVYAGEIEYTQSGSFNTDLERLRANGEGFMDSVHTLRDTHGADMVSLWINDSSSCGIAYLMTTLSAGFHNSAFSVVHYDCATGYFSFAHELAHNMGCVHDRDNTSNQGLYPYSYGWRFEGWNGTTYRTIMAYAPGTRIQRFSNPDVTFAGTPTGVPVGQSNQSHNAQTINSSTATVANFRQAILNSKSPEIIWQQVRSQTVLTGEPVTFSVYVAGASPISYQWHKNGSPISGATQSSYSIPASSAGDAGSYYLTVSNAFGTVESDTATLVVLAAVPLADALDNHDLTWNTGGDALWFGQQVVHYDGVDAAQSAAITHGGVSWLETSVTGPGILSFRWKVSSEPSFDFLRFYRNGTLQTQISGEINWQLRTFNIPAGNHTIRWAYTKDLSVSEGADMGWVDQVTYVPAAAVVPTSATVINGEFQFSFSGTPGVSYTVYGSTNFSTWIPLTNFIATNSTMLFKEPVEPGFIRRFYRVRTP